VQPWLRLADEIVVSSTYLHDVFARHGFPTTVIPAAVDTRAFAYRERGGGLKCLSVRNLAPYYRIDTILAAFARIRLRRREATLTVAGIGPLDAELRAKASALGLDGAVRFLGRVEPGDVPQLYAEADVLLNASVVDNQPGSILEAFAAGLPVISTPTGGIAELVRNGRTGLTVPPNDPDRMGDVVVWLADHPQIGRELGRRARALVRDYTWEATRHLWAGIYGAPQSALDVASAAQAV
jgi:glycosyltransferase involved in cell wall biosynthesis